MPVINIANVATFNSEKDRYEIDYIVKNQDGSISTRTSVLQDTEIKAISDQVVSDLSTTLLKSDFFLDRNITETSFLNYKTTHFFIEDTLVVYVNGLNTTGDLLDLGTNSFRLPDSYERILDEDSVIVATYVKLIV